MKNNNLAFIVSIVSLVLSIVVIILFFYRVSPNSVVDLGTFIGIAVALIAISVTMLIGYQIYNAIEIRQKLVAIDDLEEKLQNAKKDFEMLKIEQNEGMFILQARLFANNQMTADNAFIKFNCAIKYSLDVDHKEDGYNWMMDELERYALKLNTGFPFSGGNSEVEKKVDIYKSYIDDDIAAIRAHPNYFFIRDRYEKLVNAFYTRMDKIKRMEFVSIDSIYDDV